ncbi:MAG: pyrroline-5-carboxylate reductase [Sphingomonadales bacterium]|nr:MAG: pyrroline-5-carboxylate reductase [Sphingomonadales bacterium]
MLVGCGNMGGAMLAGWLRSGVPAASITVIDPSLASVPAGIQLLGSIPAGHAPPTVIVLAVKPQKLAEIAPSLVELAGPSTVLVSVLAAVEFTTLRHYFPSAGLLVRAVPNLPAAIGRGVTALVGDGGDGASRALAETLFSPLGVVEWMDDESLCAIATTVSGATPAFFFRIADAMALAAEAQGLGREQALRLIAETMAGSAAMLAEAGADPADMARRVASPGGVTLAGLKILDEADALTRLMGDTIAASAARNDEMTRAFRPQTFPQEQ